jgi:hypothetical protein
MDPYVATNRVYAMWLGGALMRFLETSTHVSLRRDFASAREIAFGMASRTDLRSALKMACCVTPRLAEALALF